MRMMRAGTAIAAAGLVLAGCLPALVGGGGLPVDFLGGWEGRGVQNDAPGEWTISADLVGGEPGGIVGTIAYPSLRCRGELRLRGASAVAMELDEHITAGPCVDGGIIILTAQEDGRLRYFWRKDASEAKGMLSRRGT
jgi:hypothetical protein